MDNSTEIKKVITVDLGNTATSLKDYKKHIDDLRGSLLQLDEASEEYKEISQEIKNEQDKLNEVMKAGKYDVDAAEGSYNQLTKTMSELKKEWKATADEARRAELGQQILEINNQLKDLDQSTGDFHRSVGDYANAFEQAFDKCLDGVKSLDGPIGDLGGTVKNLLPVIKNVNKTAVAGLSGVKKALASTGIGLIIVAVGELVAHWQDLLNIVGVSQEDMQEFKEKAINAFKNIVSGAVGVGNAVGNFLLAPIRATIEAFKGLGNIVKDVFTGDFSKIKEDAAAAFEAIKGIGQKAIDFKGNYEQGKAAADNMIAVIEERMKSPEVEEKAVEAGRAVGKAVSKGMAEGVADEETVKEIDSKTQAILDRLHQRNTDEIQLLTEKYEAEKALLEQYGLDTTELTEEYEAAKEAVIDKRLEAERKAIEEVERAEEALKAKQLKNAEEVKKKKQQAFEASLSVASSVFGALGDLAEENSEEAKAFAIMQTTIDTLSGAIAAYKSMAEVPYVGAFLGPAAAAAVTLAGMANIAKIRSTTKESGGSASVSAPQSPSISMTSVSPLLNEQADINRLDTAGLQDNAGQQDIRCYVVEQDISDAQGKVKVVEDNATF